MWYNHPSYKEATIAKLSKGENVHTDALVKICKALSCDTSDIMEIEHIDG